jgi:hypothetical protein
LTNRANPTDKILHGGEACPKGYYCEGGRSNPSVPCPKGTFNDKFAGKAAADCQLCNPNFYNDQIAQVGCRPCGAFA